MTETMVAVCHKRASAAAVLETFGTRIRIASELPELGDFERGVLLLRVPLGGLGR